MNKILISVIAVVAISISAVIVLQSYDTFEKSFNSETEIKDIIQNTKTSKNIPDKITHDVDGWMDCTNSKGSKIQESYPAICVYENGSKVQQPIVTDDKQGWSDCMDSPHVTIVDDVPRRCILPNDITFVEPDMKEASDTEDVTSDKKKANIPLILGADWGDSVSTKVIGNYLVVKSNGIPEYDYSDIPARNPHTVTEQDYNFHIKLYPEYTGEMTEPRRGPIGVTLTGLVFFDMYDRDGNDANSLERDRFDSCDGHPASGGKYHYHMLSSCFEDSKIGHSKIFGFAFDGFPVYGFNGVDGKPPTDLDECNGHNDLESYHYHATETAPYLVGCFNG